MNYLRPLLVLAGIMLLLAALPESYDYGFYQLLRIVVTLAAVYGVYVAFKQEQPAWVWVLGIIAVLFNPIVPIHLDKETWMFHDVVAGILMFVASTKLKHRDL